MAIFLNNQWYSHTDGWKMMILIFMYNCPHGLILWNSFVLKITKIAFFNITPTVPVS